MENLIDNANTLFDERLPTSPPLPPAPAGEPVPVFSYGSSHTKVDLPPLPPSAEVLGVDFTPQLPSRPAGSIHPSTRSNPPMSPSRLNADPSAPTQPIPPAALLPRIQTVTDATEQSTRESLVSDTSTFVEKAPVPAQGFVPPPIATATATRERYQGEQQLEAEPAPETPLTATSLADSSLNFSP